MDKVDERFMNFWVKWRDRKWAFVATFGGAFGAAMILIFAIKSVYFGKVVDNWGDYFGSKIFLSHLIGLGIVAGGIYGWLMLRYCVKTEAKLKEKYHG